MADKPKEKSPAPEATSSDGHTFAFNFFIVMIILLALTPFLSSLGFGSFDDNSKNNFRENYEENYDQETDENQITSKKRGFNWFFKSNYKLGEKIVAKKGSEVRRTPGGLILGEQKAGVSGRVIEGPVEKFGFNWWRIDFVEAPDGWVAENDVTNSVGLFHFINFFLWIFGFLKEFLIGIGIIALILVIWLSIKRRDIYKTKEEKRKLEKENVLEKNNPVLKIANLPVDEMGEAPKTKPVVNRRWENIRSLINTHNINDWKQAIIEADIILDEMLEKMGYHGESVGEKLKQIEPSDFLTLNEAWEAHKVRNRIAHDGQSYKISKDEAEKVIGNYEKVFKEFYYI